jgi:hypothetical protein
MVLLMILNRYYSITVASLESVQSVAEHQCTDVCTTVWLDVLHTVAAAEASLSRGTSASQGKCTTIILGISSRVVYRSAHTGHVACCPFSAFVTVCDVQ